MPFLPATHSCGGPLCWQGAERQQWKAANPSLAPSPLRPTAPRFFSPSNTPPSPTFQLPVSFTCNTQAEINDCWTTLILYSHEAAVECDFTGRTFHSAASSAINQWQERNPYRWQQISGRLEALEARTGRKLASPPEAMWPSHFNAVQKRLTVKVIVAVSRRVNSR